MLLSNLRPFLFALVAAPAFAQTTVFSTDFESALPAAIAPGTALATGVQGYAGLGPAGNQFGGSFLRSETGNVVTLSLTGLPAHSVLQLDFLFAAIDSLDGTGTYPSGDYFKIAIDGVTVFREAFANAGTTQIQTYVPPAGVELARHQDLGFSGPGSYYTDSAYALGLDPYFASIAHTGSAATITFVIEGPGIQPLGDESWAMDNLAVRVGAGTIGTVAAYGTGCGPVLGATNAPRIAQPFGLTVGNLPAGSGAAFIAYGADNVAFGTLVLPYPLDVYGMPGCWLLQSMNLWGAMPLALAAGAATGTLNVPANPAFVGTQFYGQAWVAAPGVNATGIALSNGLRIRVGS